MIPGPDPDVLHDVVDRVIGPSARLIREMETLDQQLTDLREQPFDWRRLHRAQREVVKALVTRLVAEIAEKDTELTVLRSRAVCAKPWQNIAEAAEAEVARLTAEVAAQRIALQQIAKRDNVRNDSDRPAIPGALERWDECVQIAKAALRAAGEAPR